MMISDEPFVVFLLCNPSRIWPGTVPELPSGTTRGTAKIAQKLEGQNGSVVAPFDLLTPDFRSSFQCAQLLGKWSGADFGARSGEFLARLGKVAKTDQKCGLENMELDGFGVVVAPFGLGLAVVRGTGSRFPYRPLFGPIGAPGAQ